MLIKHNPAFMKIFNEHITLILAAVFCSCDSPAEIGGSEQNNSEGAASLMTPEVFDSTELTMGSALAGHYDEVYDTTTVIEFVEMKITINRLVVYDEEGMLTNLVEGDTVYLWVELAETVEGQQITIEAPELKNIVLEQRYETSISISAEGPHCDLVDWKHYDSDWRIIKPFSQDSYYTLVYTDEERTRFPTVSVEAVNDEIKSLCPGFLDNVEGVNSIHEYPYGISISRVYFRITGERIGNGERIEKMLVFDIPMGC